MILTLIKTKPKSCIACGLPMQTQQVTKNKVKRIYAFCTDRKYCKHSEVNN